MVVCHALNDLVGEVTKRSLNGDMEYDYMVSYSDGAIEWTDESDLREQMIWTIGDCLVVKCGLSEKGRNGLGLVR